MCDKVRQAAAKGPVVMMPTHRSYFDFLLMSFIGFAFELTPPHIVAAEDFLNLGCGGPTVWVGPSTLRWVGRWVLFSVAVVHAPPCLPAYDRSRRSCAVGWSVSGW